MAQSRNPAPSPWERPHSATSQWRWTGGAEGNARLTAMNGLVLLVLLFVEGMTILALRRLFPVHAFVGLLLIPPILLKLASTGYRFVRYYTGSRAYRAAGPPHPLPRVIAPVLVLATVALFGTGVMLLVAGPGNGEPWRRLHSLSFFLWFWVMAVHVLTYALRAPRLALPDLQLWTGRPAGGRVAIGTVTRQGLVLGSLLLGLAIAIAALPLDASWVHWLTQFHPDR